MTKKFLIYYIYLFIYFQCNIDKLKKITKLKKIVENRFEECKSFETAIRLAIAKIYCVKLTDDYFYNFP